MMTILEALRDPALFGPWFKKGNWRAWEAFLAALFGLPAPSTAHRDLYVQHTGRKTYPHQAAREGWMVIGRRGGKSRIAALVAVYIACFRNYRPHLAPGEVATVSIIAADRKQARTVLRYVLGFLEHTPMLAKMITSSTRETIELRNRCVIEIHTASFRSTRGYTLAAVIADEVAFWRSEDSANPDSEILNGLRPGLATLPDAMLLALSSPYARRGALWDAYRRHYGHDGPVLVWQAPTHAMNPTVSQAIIDEAYEQDEASAAAEYGAEFRRDIESYVSREALDACTIPDRHELPPVTDCQYRAFVDPSGGSIDSFTVAIAHAEGPRVVLDCVRERKPPFSPADVVQEFATLCQGYHVTAVTGDRYAGEWPREQFRKLGIRYEPSDRPKSDLYRDCLPLLTSTQAELLDHARLLHQLATLERRTARGGRDSIDHPPNGHDDVANAACGALVLALHRALPLVTVQPLIM